MADIKKPIEVHEYNSEWTNEFNRIKEKIESIIGDLIIDIHHVGSTSIEGLAAKPIIDIDVEIQSYDAFNEIVERLIQYGYVHNGNQGIEGREVFKQTQNDGLMSYHFYVCQSDCRELRRHIRFRDFLNENHQLRDEYAELKKQLAIKYRNDREAYTDSKTDFIKSVMIKAGESEG